MLLLIHKKDPQSRERKIAKEPRDVGVEWYLLIPCDVMYF